MANRSNRERPKLALVFGNCLIINHIHSAKGGIVSGAITAYRLKQIRIVWDDSQAAAWTPRRAREKKVQMDIRLGNGFDVHAFEPGDHVILCGIELPFEKALAGHSDADVGMHAITDAVYGALAEGDIGRHFPPSDPQWKGADSQVFLAHAIGLASDRNYAIANIDCTLICEAPKIGPHAEAMRQKLSALTGVEVARISVKATTSERLGFTGRGEGIAALATVALVGK